MKYRIRMLQAQCDAVGHASERREIASRWICLKMRRVYWKRLAPSVQTPAPVPYAGVASQRPDHTRADFLNPLLSTRLKLQRMHQASR